MSIHVALEEAYLTISLKEMDMHQITGGNRSSWGQWLNWGD